MYIPRISDILPTLLDHPIARKLDAHSGPTQLMDNSTSAIGDSCDDIHHCRTIFQILWSCIGVIVACTWVAVHPNLPGPNESSSKILWRRLRLMLITLVAPEILVVWASRQWYAARKLAQRFRDDGWTTRHAHFAVMGGFQELNEDFFAEIQSYMNTGTKGPINNPKLLEYIQRIGRQFTEVEIQDRSHRDALAKFLAMGQTGWFIAQLIARHVEGLSITELEVMTAAFAAINLLIYTFWWNKPQGVRCSINLERVPLSPPSPKPSRLKSHCIANSLFLIHPKLNLVLLSTHSSKQCLLWTLMNGLMWYSNSHNFQPKSGLHKLLQAMDNARLFVKRQGIIFCLIFPALYCFLFVSTTIIDKDDLNGLAERNFFKPRVGFHGFHQLYLYLHGTAMVFGAIHCAAWNFYFPTEAEQTLWRICAAVTTSIPLLIICYDYLGYTIEDTRIELPVEFALSFVILFYIFARWVLIVQAFIALRRLPSTAYETVEWVNLLPHI
ncbi:hypothetical protein C8R42DRAFT_609486 [Lentinula raphanica]|nr:hypothetical protein C8R42DRAFT_609486 [Lentinula raphanica]